MAKKIGENGMYISKKTLFWRTQRECWRRMVTPYAMYLFMSMTLLATQMIPESLSWLSIILGIVCIAIGMFFNGHLAYNAGMQHYDALLTGNIHRRNIEAGIESGGDHRLEREYAPWKGFYIGFLVGLPVILFAGLACIPGAMNEEHAIGKFMLLMFAGFAIVPVGWCYQSAGVSVPAGGYAWAMLFVIVPIVITGVFYIVGALVNQKRKQAQTAAQEAALKEKNAPKEYREQTEEQKRKTQQSKKKKK